MKKFYFLLSAFLLSMTMMMVSCDSDKKGSDKDDKDKTEKSSKIDEEDDDDDNSKPKKSKANNKSDAGSRTSESAEQWVREYERLAYRFVEAYENGDEETILSLNSEMEELQDHGFTEDDFTPEQQQRIQAAMMKFLNVLQDLDMY